jgi:hypothetical protein
MPRTTQVGSNARNDALHAVVEQSLRQIAHQFDVEPALVRNAVDHATASTHQMRSEVVIRLQVATDDLVRELGGRASLQTWSREAIPALGGTRPIDILAAGKIGVLERVGKVLSAGVIS